MDISEAPEKWVIIKIVGNDQTHYKVFGTWIGDSLTGDRWQVNSGIAEVETDADFYYFKGYSGSCYKCHKKSYGVASTYGISVLDNIIEQSKGTVLVEDDRLDWGDLV